MRTSFHHQPEAQHPKSSVIHKYAGRLPHLMDAEAEGADWHEATRIVLQRDPMWNLTGPGAAGKRISNALGPIDIQDSQRS